MLRIAWSSVNGRLIHNTFCYGSEVVPVQYKWGLIHGDYPRHTPLAGKSWLAGLQEFSHLSSFTLVGKHLNTALL